MDKRTLTAFVLIGLIFVIWMVVFSPQPQEPPPGSADTTIVANETGSTDTSGSRSGAGDSTGNGGATGAPQVNTNDPLAAYTTGGQRYLTIETPLYTAKLNTLGGLLARFELKEYNAWYGAPVQLIDDSTGFPGELGLTYTGANGEQVDTRNFYFELPEGTLTVGEGDSVVVTARLVPSAGMSGMNAADSTDNGGDTTSDSTAPATGGALPVIEKRFVFYADSYDVGVDITAPGIESYTLNWTDGLKYQEHNSVDESSKAMAYAMVNDELESFNAEKDQPAKSESFSGSVQWIGTKTKYFAAALIPAASISTQATLSGTAVPADSNGLVETYNMELNVPAASGTQNFTLFIGPLEYDRTQKHDLTGMIDYGYLEFVVRPIAEYVLLPIFRFLHSLISNWGVVIIIFSILIRGALWPLSIPQIKSSEKMRLVQPMVTELRDKYKDDPQKMQMETMKVYREYGVNPVGGCLPLILQLPVLYALFTTLSNAIDLRQAGFALWINDLSIPDTIIHLPFSIPLIGTQLSGLALIMGATLFIQQRLMITDPKQKAIVYIMPIFLTVAFNSFPSGLNLYYLIYNLLSIGQHYYMRNMSKSSLTLEQLKAQSKNKKQGWLSKKMEEAQKMAEMQGKNPPGKGGGRR